MENQIPPCNKWKELVLIFCDIWAIVNSLLNSLEENIHRFAMELIRKV